MDRLIDLDEVNRNFAEIVREVGRGVTYVVTDDGAPVAKIAPVDPTEYARLKAREALLARLEKQPAIDVGKWTRDELYER